MAKAAPITGLNCDGPVEEALRIVLARRLSEMVSLRKRALNFNDPEGVHDMRVSSRRLRSALRDFEPHLKRAKISRQLKQIRALADYLGEVRDDDVAIIALEKMLSNAPSEAVEGLHRIIAEKKAQRKEAQRELVGCLNYRALVQLDSTFKQALAAVHSPVEENGKPGLTYKKFAQRTIRRRIRELEKLSSSLHRPNKTTPLHDMRIAAKRLRYAVELFAPCWDDSLKHYAQQIAKLQASLGELHDYDLWVEYCSERLRKISRHKPDPSIAIDEEALAWLLGSCARIRAKHYRDALLRWQSWKSSDLLGQLKATIAPDKEILVADASVVETPVEVPTDGHSTAAREVAPSEVTASESEQEESVAAQP